MASFNRDRVTVFGLPDDRLTASLVEARRAAARLVNADVAEIALATNTSYGINLAAAGLPFEDGDIVLVSDGEFPANVYPWMQLGRRGARLEVVPCTGDGWPDEERIIERMADSRVRVLAISFVQFATGYRADLDRLAARAGETDTRLVVDAIQGLGHMPFDVRRTPVDVLACGAQKWLLSPWGAGFVYVRRELLDTLQPPWTGWLAYRGNDDYTRLTNYDPRLHDDARRFELVTLPFQDMAGMTPSIDLLLGLGIADIATHIERIQQPVLAWADRRGVRVASPRDAHRSGMLCVAPPDPARALERLVAGGVLTSLREGAIRLAPHCFNTMEEMERVAGMLDAAL